jgi:hypothetical protein
MNMANTILLPSQIQYLYRIIERNALLPADFSYEEVNFGPLRALNIHYTGSEYFFQIKPSVANESFKVSCSPGQTGLTFDGTSDISLGMIGQYFSSWLDWLKREVDAHNYLRSLSELKQTVWFLPRVFETVDDVSNEPFNKEEILNLRNSFEGLKEKIDSNQEVLLEKLDYIMKKAESMGKIDWKNIAVGSLMSLLAEGVPKEMIQMVVDFLSRHVIKILPPAI